MHRFITAALAVAIVAALVVLGSHPEGPGLVDAQGLAPCTFPAAGTDFFPSSAAEVTIQLDPPFPGEPEVLRLEGLTQIDRGDPGDSNGNGVKDIETEIVSMSLMGTSTLLGGPVTLRESPTLESTGLIETKPGTSTDFPADSFFDVFFEMDTPFGTAYNIDPFTMAYTIYCIPPEGAAYQPPPGAPTFVDIWMDGLPDPVGRIIHAKHIPLPEKPLFSVRPVGPSGLNPADIYTITAAGGPPVVVIPDFALGLMGGLPPAGDDVNALSQTEPIWDVLLPDIRFSVDDVPLAGGSSLGLPGTGVNAEATKVLPEAHGDEFNMPFPGTNALFMDEGLFGLVVSDDIDGLAEPLLAPPFVAFSLAAGSPALMMAGATEADILVPGPVVAVPGALLGLLPGDDLDALCWFDSNGSMFPEPPPIDFYLFSLTPASPTLGAIGATPDDLLAPALPVPFVAIAAPAIGLRGAGGPDDLDALKCLVPDFLEVWLDVDTDGDTVIDYFDDCPGVPNGDQADFEGDRVGDKCDDSDIDYFTDFVELYLPTDPLDDCTDQPGDADAWPPDFDMDMDADIVDVLKFKPVIMTSVPPSPSRFDFDADGDIDIVDVLKYKPVILTSCTP